MKITHLIERIYLLGPQMGGVFSFSDLSNLMGGGSDLKNSRVIRKFIEEGVLFRVKRGLYITKSPDLWLLASRLSERCYISMDSVLAKNGLIGTIPERSVSAIHPTRKKTLQTPAGFIFFSSISKKLMFGYARTKNGIAIADSEKAFLDMLYFYTKGTRFVVDPKVEVNVDQLDGKKIRKYLNAYANPKFVKFVLGVLERGQT